MGLNLRDFQNFRRMLTPELVKIVYVVGIIFIAMLSIASIVLSFIAADPITRVIWFFGGVIGGIGGFLYLRLGCESIIVVFKILDELVAINQKLTPSRTERSTDGYGRHVKRRDGQRTI